MKFVINFITNNKRLNVYTHRIKYQVNRRRKKKNCFQGIKKIIAEKQTRTHTHTQTNNNKRSQRSDTRQISECMTGDFC
jgi:hypothetical protein